VRRLVFITQQVDPEHPALAATVAKLHALAAHVDELVVLADGIVPSALPANARARSFRSATKPGRGLRFEAALARELSPRPLAVVPHMCSIYAVLAAPLVRPLGIPLVLWYTHWKPHVVLRAAEAVSTRIASVDRRTFPLDSKKVVAIGHGIDVAQFPCSEPSGREGSLRALVLGRTSAAKGVDHVVRAVGLARERGVDVELDVHGPSLNDDERRHRAELEALVRQLGLEDAVRVGGTVAPADVPRAFAEHDCLVNNMRPGATDKVVYEAAAACLPVLASNPAFDDLLGGLDLAFDREDEDALATRFAALGAAPVAERARIGRLLHERAAASHSVEAWARRLLEVVESR
jgi:glycosyltransferase involved in cell wall biosynthesis